VVISGLGRTRQSFRHAGIWLRAVAHWPAMKGNVSGKSSSACLPGARGERSAIRGALARLLCGVQCFPERLTRLS